MNWPILVSLAVLIGSWTLFLSGALDVPGWEGFGKGLAIGSLAATAPIIGFATRLFSADPPRDFALVLRPRGEAGTLPGAGLTKRLRAEFDGRASAIPIARSNARRTRAQ